MLYTMYYMQYTIYYILCTTYYMPLCSTPCYAALCRHSVTQPLLKGYGPSLSAVHLDASMGNGAGDSLLELEEGGPTPPRDLGILIRQRSGVHFKTSPELSPIGP